MRITLDKNGNVVSKEVLTKPAPGIAPEFDEKGDLVADSLLPKEAKKDSQTTAQVVAQVYGIAPNTDAAEQE